MLTNIDKAHSEIVQLLRIADKGQEGQEPP